MTIQQTRESFKDICTNDADPKVRGRGASAHLEIADAYVRFAADLNARRSHGITDSVAAVDVDQALRFAEVHAAIATAHRTGLGG